MSGEEFTNDATAQIEHSERPKKTRSISFRLDSAMIDESAARSRPKGSISECLGKPSSKKICRLGQI